MVGLRGGLVGGVVERGGGGIVDFSEGEDIAEAGGDLFDGHEGEDA